MSDQVDEIKSKIDIVELVNEYVPLKKTGRNFKACCPFHNEKTPSFIVSPERQIFHCFGCGEGGDVFKFLMKIENIEFSESLRLLAKKAGVVLKQFQPTGEDQIKEKLYEINHLASEFYHYLLLKHPIGKTALEYVLSRGITKKTIELFKIGFAPDLWESVSKFLIKKGYKQKDLELAGLTIKSDRRQNSYYDRFRGRAMFTLKDNRGNVVGFAGRVLNPDAKEAKYVNTPETPVYVKGNLLYGLDITKNAIKRENLAIVTEGEIDAIASYQVGIHNVVAIKGSALTENQVNLLKRYTENIALALDSDLAGDTAARRGIEIADKEGLNMRVIELLYGKDPDECIKKDPNLWRESIKKAVPIYDYVIHSSLKRFDKESPNGKKKISEEVLPIIAKISNEIVKSHYIKKIALLLDVNEEGVAKELEKTKNLISWNLQKNKSQIIATPPPKKNREELLEEYILAKIVQSENPKKIVSETNKYLSEEDFNTAVYKKIYFLLQNEVTKGKLNNETLSKTVPSELLPSLNKLYLIELTKEKDNEKEIKEIINAAKELSIISTKIKMRDLSVKIKKSEMENKSEDVEKISHEFQILREKLHFLQSE